MHTVEKLSPSKKRFFAILVYIIIPLGGVSTDIYLPSLPAISAHFHAIKTLAQLTVTAYVMALGLAQLFAGPISDALGRKKPLIIAVVVQLLSVVAIIFSQSIYWMIFLYCRLNQG